MRKSKKQHSDTLRRPIQKCLLKSVGGQSMSSYNAKSQDLYEWIVAGICA